MVKTYVEASLEHDGSRSTVPSEHHIRPPKHYKHPSQNRIKEMNSRASRAMEIMPKLGSSGMVCTYQSGDGRGSSSTVLRPISWRSVIGNASILRVSLHSRGTDFGKKDFLLHFPCPILLDSIHAFCDQNQSSRASEIALCAVTCAGTLHRIIFATETSGKATGPPTFESASAIDPTEVDDVYDDIRCAVWISSSKVVIGGSDSRMLRVCTRSKDGLWTLSFARDLTTARWIFESVVKASTKVAPSISLAHVRFFKSKNLVASVGMDSVIRLWDLDDAPKCEAKFRASALGLRMTEDDGARTFVAMSAGSVKGGASAATLAVHVARNDSGGSCFVYQIDAEKCDDRIRCLGELESPASETSTLVSVSADESGRLWALRSAGVQTFVSCYRIVHGRMRSMKNVCVVHMLPAPSQEMSGEGGTFRGDAEMDGFHDLIESALENARIACSRRDNGLMNDSREDIGEMDPGAPQPHVACALMDDFFIRRVSAVGRFCCEAVVKALDDFAHYSGLPRQNKDVRLDWSQLMAQCRRAVEYETRSKVASIRGTEIAPHARLVAREESWRRLIHFCCVSQDFCMQPLSLITPTPVVGSSLTPSLLVRVGFSSLIWTTGLEASSVDQFGSRGATAYSPVRRAIQCMDAALLRSLGPNPLVDFGLGHSADPMYEDENLLRQVVEDIVDRLSQVRRGDGDVDALYSKIVGCFDGVARPGALLRNYADSLDPSTTMDVTNQRPSSDERTPRVPSFELIAPVVGSLIRVCRWRFERFQRLLILSTYLQRTGLPWTSQNQLFSTSMRRLQYFRILARISTMRTIDSATPQWRRPVLVEMVSSEMSERRTKDKRAAIEDRASTTCEPVLCSFLNNYGDVLKDILARFRGVGTMDCSSRAVDAALYMLWSDFDASNRKENARRPKCSMFSLLNARQDLSLLGEYATQMLPLSLEPMRNAEWSSILSIATGNVLLGRAQSGKDGEIHTISDDDDAYGRAADNFTQAVLLLRCFATPTSTSPHTLCMRVAHAFQQLSRPRLALSFAFMALEQQSENADVWALVLDICMSDIDAFSVDFPHGMTLGVRRGKLDRHNLLYSKSLRNVYDMAYFAILTGDLLRVQQQQHGKRILDDLDISRFLHKLVERRHLSWATGDCCPPSLWSSVVRDDSEDASTPLLLGILRESARHNALHSSSADLLYSVCIARQRYREAAQVMLDLADMLEGVRTTSPEQVILRRKRCLLAATTALQLVPRNRAFLMRRKVGSSSSSGCEPVLVSDIRRELRLAKCRDLLHRRGVVEASAVVTMGVDQCIGACLRGQLFREAHALASTLPVDRAAAASCRIVRALSSACVESQLSLDSGDGRESSDVVDDLWRQLRELLRSQAVRSIDDHAEHRGKVWLSALDAILRRSKLFGLPGWLESLFIGNHDRSVVVACVSPEETCSPEEIGCVMCRFGALEFPPIPFGSKATIESKDVPVSIRRYSGIPAASLEAGRIVLVTFKSSLAANAAVAAHEVRLPGGATDRRLRIRRKRAGEDTAGHFAGSRADPAQLIRALLDAGLVREACDVAILSFELFDAQSANVVSAQPMWIPSSLLGELIWRACVACAHIYGTLQKRHSSTGSWHARLCVAWRPYRDGPYVLEVAPQMSEVSKIVLKHARVKQVDALSFELQSDGNVNHIFRVANAKEMSSWMLAMRKMTEATDGGIASSDEFGIAKSALRSRIARLRALVEDAVRSSRDREQIRRLGPSRT